MQVIEWEIPTHKLAEIFESQDWYWAYIRRDPPIPSAEEILRRILDLTHAMDEGDYVSVSSGRFTVRRAPECLGTYEISLIVGYSTYEPDDGEYELGMLA